MLNSLGQAERSQRCERRHDGSSKGTKGERIFQDTDDRILGDSDSWRTSSRLTASRLSH